MAAISKATAEVGNDVRVFGLSSPGWRDGDSSVWTGAPATVFETSRWSGPLKYARQMFRALMDFSPDVVHLHGLWTYPSIAVYRWHRRTGRSFVVSGHGMLMPASLSYKPRRKILARRLFQDRVLRAAGVLHATSEDEHAAYGALGFTGSSILIPLGINKVAPPIVDRNSARRRVLFLGRLHHQKGLDWLFDAWIRLEREFPDWDLSIVGPLHESFADCMAVLRQKVRGTRINFHDPLYGDDKFSWIAGSDLLVMPSRSENFGLAAAEALMMEVPVIATRGTPWSGLTENNSGWWIEPGVLALEAALRDAMQTPPAALRQMGRNGRNWIERDFSWRVIGCKWQAVYEGLLRVSSR